MQMFLQHAMMFFLHHCELPALNNVHILNPAPVNLHLHLQPVVMPHHVEDHDMPQEEDASEEDPVESSSEPEGNEQLVGGTNQQPSNEDLALAGDQESHGPDPPGAQEDHLMRPQLRRTSSDAISASASVVSNSPQSGLQKLSDEELRLARLQRFEKKIE